LGKNFAALVVPGTNSDFGALLKVFVTGTGMLLVKLLLFFRDYFLILLVGRNQYW
jgi:hypothetical protein